MLQKTPTNPRFEEAARVVSPFFTGQINPATSDDSLEAFIAQVLPLYLHSPEKSLLLAQEQLSGPISSYAFTSQFAADAAFPTDQTKSLGAIRAKFFSFLFFSFLFLFFLFFHLFPDGI